MMYKKCCFTGHRPKDFLWKYDEQDIRCIALKEKLKAEIEASISAGYNYFISGMSTGWDTWAAEGVLDLKKLYPHIRLECAIPCLGQERLWLKESKVRYKEILSLADAVHYVTKEPYKPWSMDMRNAYMINNSTKVIACYSGMSSGGTYNTIKLATQKNKEVVNLW